MSTPNHSTLGFAVTAITLAAIGPATAQPASFFAERVVAVDPGPGTAGSATDVLGGPTGNGAGFGASSGVFSLGTEGSITLGFGTAETPSAIFDGPGADFIVFENAFFVGGNPSVSFAELLFVEVSTSGNDDEFVRFPTSTPSTSVAGAFTVTDPATATGFAGVSPVLANVDTNDIDPFDPDAAGGDAFDLADLAALDAVLNGTVDLNNIRFIRLIDVADIDGPGGSADLDAVAVINGVIPEPTAGLLTLLGLAGLSVGRRRLNR